MAQPVIGITLIRAAPRLPEAAVVGAARELLQPIAGGRRAAAAVAAPSGYRRRKADRIDALIVTGGNFNVDPALFGAATRHQGDDEGTPHRLRDRDPREALMPADMPVLGICGGQQLLNVVLGGTLIQHIPDESQAALAHEQPIRATSPAIASL